MNILKVFVFVNVTQIVLMAQDSSLVMLRPAEHQVPGGVAGEDVELRARELN